MRNPFVGLRPFQSAESALFFGRSRDVAVLQNLVLSVSVLVLYAPSGTGKSSLLNAGLLPALEDDPALLTIAIADPRETVLKTVPQKLASKGWVDDAQAETGGLAKTLERHMAATGRRVILVLDQFEERLKQRESLDALYAEIARLANTRSDAATVIISIREDYLGSLERLMRRVSGLLDGSYRVPNLSRDALMQAVHGPLNTVGNNITPEDGLVEEVLTDLERQAAPSELLDDRMPDSRLPAGHIEPGYFQIVWSHLWAKEGTHPQRQLTRNTYQREGRAEGILKSFVFDTLGNLLPFEAEVLRAALRYMVLPTGAKVALTIDDLLDLLRRDDFTSVGNFLLVSTRDESGPQLTADEKEIIGKILKSVFDQLTRTDAPLFRRVMRAGREEFELIHDLLGQILPKWRIEYESAVNMPSILANVSDNINGHFESSSKSSRVTQKVSRSKLRTADELLIAYGRKLEKLNTVDDAKENEQILKSAVLEIRATSDLFGYTVPTAELQKTVQRVEEELNAIALNHPSRNVRRMMQQQALAFKAMSDQLQSVPPGFTGSPGKRTLRNVLGWIMGFALAIAGTYANYWLIGQVWHVPLIQYLPLTFVVVAVFAATLYTFVYSDKPATAMLEWSALVQTLWPKLRTLYQRDESEVYSRAIRSFVILVWWPIHFLVLELIAFSGAALFQVFDWSPTAGFNLLALIASLVLSIAYLIAAMEL